VCNIFATLLFTSLCCISLCFGVVLFIIVRTFVRRKSWGLTPGWSRKLGAAEKVGKSEIDFWRAESLFIVSGSCRRWATIWLCSTRGLDASPSVRRGALATLLFDAVADVGARRRLCWRYCAVLGRCRRRRGTLGALTLSACSQCDVHPSLARRRFRWLFSCRFARRTHCLRTCFVSPTLCWLIIVIYSLSCVIIAANCELLRVRVLLELLGFRQ